jgi:hypothetical protein
VEKGDTTMILIDKDDNVAFHVRTVSIEDEGSVEVYYDTVDGGGNPKTGHASIYPNTHKVELFLKNPGRMVPGNTLEDSAFKLVF